MKPSESLSLQATLLILTSSTGSGHDKRAEAIEAWCQHLYKGGVKVHVEHIIENSSALGRFGVGLYNLIQKHAPFLHHLYFFIVELFTYSHHGSVSYGGKYYRNLINELKPTHIISVHDSTNNGYFEDARKCLGETNVRCVTYCGEFTGGYGFSRNWIAKSVDHFFARTPHTQQTAIRAGIPAERTSVYQKVLPPQDFENLLTTQDKEKLLDELNLNKSRFTLFLATGGFGANHHLAYLKALLPLADQIQIIVVCGRNEKVLKKVNQWAQAHPQMKLHTEGYSHRMASFLQISNAIVSRGGANTSMEAVHYGCPLIYDTLGGLMPQEYCTVRYFIKNEATHLLRQSRDLARIIDFWLKNPKSYEIIKSNMQGLNRNEDPRAFIQTLFENS